MNFILVILDIFVLYTRDYVLLPMNNTPRGPNGLFVPIKLDQIGLIATRRIPDRQPSCFNIIMFDKGYEEHGAAQATSDR
jgi:hypothetical protein